MRRVVLLGLLLALTACGSREVSVGAHDALAARAVADGKIAAADADVSRERSEEEDTVRSSSRPAVASKKQAKPKPLPSGLEPHSDMPLKVSLSRTCVEPGGSMSATAKTVKNAGLGFATAYPDNSQAPDFTFVPREANPTGEFTWTWVVRPTMRTGDALLMTTAYTANGRSATHKHPFRIAQSC